MDWSKSIYLAADLTWSCLGIASLALALFVLARKKILESLAARRACIVLFGVYLPGLIALLKLAQFLTYQAAGDSGTFANMVWNTAHGFGFNSSVLGDRSYFTYHFAFTSALLAPLLWLWNSIAILSLVQGVVIASSVLGVYWLSQKYAPKDSLFPCAAALLAASHPLFKILMETILDNSVYAFPFFIWMVYFWESRKKMLALISALLLLTTREQAPFIFFGLGLYFLFENGPRHWRGPVFLMAGAIVLWFAEMGLINRVRGDWNLFSFWDRYSHLGGSLEAVTRRAVTRPWDFLAALVYPWPKLWTVAGALLQAALLPAAAGAALFPLLVSWLPNQLADPTLDYHKLQAHYSAFMLGPLLWAGLRGMRRVLGGINQRHHRHLVVAILLVAAVNFLTSGGYYHPEVRVVPGHWATSAPRALAHVPRDAKVWCDGYLLPHLAMRRYVKVLPYNFSDPYFGPNLFLPDYVVLSLYWAQIMEGSEPGSSRRIFKFLGDRGFQTVFREKDLLVLAHPDAGKNSAVEWVAIP